MAGRKNVTKTCILCSQNEQQKKYEGKRSANNPDSRRILFRTAYNAYQVAPLPYAFLHPYASDNLAATKAKTASSFLRQQLRSPRAYSLCRKVLRFHKRAADVFPVRVQVRARGHSIMRRFYGAH